MNKVVNYVLGGLFACSAIFAHANKDYPHAHHRAMMKQDNYQRSLVNYQLPQVTLQDAAGQELSLQDAIDRDKTVVLNFIFTSCPTICPVLSAVFAQSQSLFEKENAEVQLVSISIDPEHDTPARLRDYADKFNANNNWSFLTGQLQDIIKVQKAFNIYRGNKMNHIPATFILTPDADQWLRIDGFTNAKQLVQEYHRLLHKH
jgi:protein SCO1/2